jgi:alanyl-tRNA synthetase
VDTGMGFERVAAIIQTTSNFTNFNKPVSNYDTDIFSPIFAELEKLSGHQYTATLPVSGQKEQVEQEKIDIAFRVIGDHIRTLSFSIADGILPGNNDRNYVLRRILRRAVRYGRTLGFNKPFFHQLVNVLVESMGDIFPELQKRRETIQQVIRAEEESFNKTLDRGIELFRKETVNLDSTKKLTGEFAFKLYDTYGFPLDLTELMAREAGLTVDTAGFDALMEQQRDRARAAQKKETISVSSISPDAFTEFVGFDQLAADATVLEIIEDKERSAVIVDRSPFYAEMGGQVGDTGSLSIDGNTWNITGTQKTGDAFLHFIEGKGAPEQGNAVQLQVDDARRGAIQRHHTVTHLFHWALHEVASKDAAQKGSFVGPDKLTFDFNSQALTPQQVIDIEQLVNERIIENTTVSWTETAHADVTNRTDILQFFGDKYGDTVRVVQIGGGANALDGFSMELCGGTHTNATGEIGLFRITGESAIAAGVRRVEAVAGFVAAKLARNDSQRILALAESLNSPVKDIEKKLDQMLEQSKQLEKQMKALQQSRAADTAKGLLGQATNAENIACITANLGESDGNFTQAVADALKGLFEGVVVLGATGNGNAVLVATVSDALTDRAHAGKLIQAIAPIVSGKGGGKPTQARGGGSDAGKLDEALAEVRKILAH